MGRKKADDPKVRIDVWVHTSTVEQNGGIEKSKKKIISYLEAEASKEKNKN